MDCLERLPAGPIHQLLGARFSIFHAERCDCGSPLGRRFGDRPCMAGSGWRTFSETVLGREGSYCGVVLTRPLISIWSADWIATKLGTHLVLLYPELYADDLEVAS